jgi:hypothetical protein
LGTRKRFVPRGNDLKRLGAVRDPGEEFVAPNIGNPAAYKRCSVRPGVKVWLSREGLSAIESGPQSRGEISIIRQHFLTKEKNVKRFGSQRRDFTRQGVVRGLEKQFRAPGSRPWPMDKILSLREEFVVQDSEQ